MPPNALLVLLPALAMAQAPRPAVPAAPTIVSRASWDPGGTPGGIRYDRPLRDVYRTLVVHHSDFPEAPGPAVLKAYHLEVSGFSDLGYHFVIGPDGTIWEGRPLDRMGAHAGVTSEGARGERRADPDWGAVGIVLDGYFVDAPPPAPQQEALLSLVQHLRRRLPRIRRVLGHREVRATVEARGHHAVGPPTVCPGDALFTWLEEARTQGRLGPGLLPPPRLLPPRLPPPPLPPGAPPRPAGPVSTYARGTPGDIGTSGAR